VELEELHVFERQTLAPDDPDAVTGESVGIGCRLEDLAETTGRKNDRLALEHVQVARGQFVRDDTRGDVLAIDLRHDHVEHVVLVEEVDAEANAVLEQRLKDHVPGAIGRVTGTANRRRSMLASVTTETALVDLAFRRSVERQPHVLEVEDGIDGLFGEDLRGILIDQVVATLDGVVSVPLPVVLFDIGEGRSHAALCRASVGASRVELGDDGGVGVRSGFDCRAHPSTTGAHDDDVVLVIVNAVDDLAVGNHLPLGLRRLGLRGFS
jgi:hypothetical protein